MSCTRDPEVANNDPDAPQVELEILSRISAEISIVSMVESSDITYGGEIIQIIDGEEKGVKYSFTTESLDDNHRFSWLTENLQPNSTYVARAFITNGRNKKYSAKKTYSTPSTSKPTLSSVTQDSESLVASIVDNGGRTIEDVGFVIGDTPDRKELMRKEKTPAAAQTKERFSLPLNSLPGGKTLYVIAYAIDNQEDTGYSSTPIEVFVPQPVTSITLSHEELALVEGSTAQLEVDVQPENATDKSITWKSSDNEVATVEEGNVTAIKEGTAIITASAGEKSASCTVTVTKAFIPVSSISLSQTSLEMVKGEKVTLTVDIEPEDATDKTVSWTSSNDDIITVDNTGMVHAIGGGASRVTAVAGEQSAFCDIVVTVPVSKIKLNPTSCTLEEGQTITLYETIFPEDATDKTVTWESSDVEVATVEDGTVTAIKEGTATITASAGEKNATCTVTVNKKVIAVTSVTLDQTTLSLTEGETSTLVATVLPTDATDKTVTWESSDVEVATVEDGTVTAIKEGTATITASVGEKNATCTVTVTAAPEEGIPITSEFFPDEAFRNYICSNFDTNPDGILSRQEVMAISRIVISERKDIYSLSGIEYLDHLVILYCSSTTISSLDVSNCTQLKWLYCDDTQISSLDVSNCSLLIELVCSHTQISSLDVSNCSQLTKLECGNTQISSLDVSNCSYLTELECGFTQLSSLNLSNCTELCELNCMGNQISSLDLSGCPLLEILDCRFSLISSLVLLNCPNLRDLDCSQTQLSSLDVSNCTQLMYLDCSQTQLSSLDVSNCTQLEHLDCSQTQLSSLDVSNCTQLMYLYCDVTQISSLNVSRCPLLATLSCQHSQLSSLDLSNCAKLNLLSCSSTQLSTLDVSGCPLLEILGCSYSPISSLNLLNCSILKNLTCDDTQISSLDVSGCPLLEKLSCQYSPLSSLNLLNCSDLKSLICDRTQISSLDISGCPLLTFLSCQETPISSLNVSTCTKLTSLFCGYTQISTLDVLDCSQLMRLECESTQLSSLDLRKNMILQKLNCQSCPNLTDIWLIAGHEYETLYYDSDVTTLHYE